MDTLIQTLTTETNSNSEEIRLLQQFAFSSGHPDSERSSPPFNNFLIDRALQEKLRMEIEKNKSLGQELGVENLQRLYEERALLKRERELLKESEDGCILLFG